MTIKRSLGGLLAIALGAPLGPAMAQVPGATIGLPADLSDLGSSGPSRGASGNAGANPGGLSLGNGSRAGTGAAGSANPGGLNLGGAGGSAGGVSGSAGAGGTARPLGTGAGGGSVGGGVGGSRAGTSGGAVSRPTQTDDYLNPLYGRGIR